MLKIRTGFIVIYYLKHEQCTFRETITKIKKKRARERQEREITTVSLAAELPPAVHKIYKDARHDRESKSKRAAHKRAREGRKKNTNRDKDASA